MGISDPMNACCCRDHCRGLEALVAKQAAEIVALRQSNNRRKSEVYKANRRAEAALAEIERR